MNGTSDSAKGENGPFCGLLRDVKEGRKPIDALFENELYRDKVSRIVLWHRLKHEDAEDLLGDVNLRVFKGLAKFELDYSLEYGGFFAWVRKIDKNRLLDTLPEEVEFVDARPEDLPIVDQSIDQDEQLLNKELEGEFNRCVDAMSTRERLAFTCIVMLDLPSRTTAVILTAAGFHCSHTTVLKWASEALKRYFPKAEPSIGGLERKASKPARARAGQSEKASPSKQATKS